MPAVSVTVIGIDPEHPLPPPAPNYSCGYTFRFNNKREIWKVKRAAKAVNMNFNSFVRAVLDERSGMVLAEVERMAKAKKKRKRDATGNGTGNGMGSGTASGAAK